VAGPFGKAVGDGGSDGSGTKSPCIRTLLPVFSFLGSLTLGSRKWHSSILVALVCNLNPISIAKELAAGAEPY